MIEIKNAEIDVDELMRRIREEVRNGKKSGFPIAIPQSPNLGTAVPSVHIEALISIAQEKSRVRAKFPKPFLRFPFKYSKKLQRYALKAVELLFYDQREFNLALLESLRQIFHMNRELAEHVRILKSVVLTLGPERLDSIFNEIQALQTKASATQDSVLSLDARYARLQDEVQVTQARLAALHTQTQAVNGRIDGFEAKLESAQTAQAMEEQQVQKAMERITTLGKDAALREQEAESTRSGLIETQANMEKVQRTLGEMNRRQEADSSSFRYELVLQKQHLTRILEAEKMEPPESSTMTVLQQFNELQSHFLDAHYVAFEDRFRGPRDVIKQRVRVYLPLVSDARIGTTESPILDLGCGRGEWLELLQESGYVARGVDLNQVMLSLCRERGLDVTEGDLLEYLQKQADSSIGAVTSFHVIEHLPYEVTLKFLQQTVRVLKPDGLVIFETPNPKNVQVGSHTFYMDPTHLKPIPSPLLTFMFESSGLKSVEVKELHPYPETNLIQEESSLVHCFNSLFYGPQDYAVIARK